MYKALFGLICVAVIAASGSAYAESESERCQAVLLEWAKGQTSDNRMAFCQVEGLVSEADMKQALNDAIKISAN